MSKQTLRQTNRQILADIPPQKKAAYDAAITARFLKLLAERPADTVSVYNPMPFEVDCTTIIRELYARGKRVCFPARLNTDHAQLVFKALTEKEYDVCDKSDFFMQGGNSPLVSPDLLVIPVIGFHPIGFRLGYGGGYYDMALYSLRKEKPVLAVGVGYSFLEITDAFFESHDEKLDLILTEKKLVIPT